MGLFVDNFHRANGSVGPLWNSWTGSASISGNRLLTGGLWAAHVAPLRAPAYASMQVTAQNNFPSCWYIRPHVKANTAFTQGYYLDGQGPANAPVLNLRRFGSGGDIILGTYTASIDPTLPHTLRLTYNAGVLTAYLDGTAVVTVGDSTWASNDRVGMVPVSAGIYISEAVAEGDVATEFSITPNTIGIANAPTSVSFVGTNTTWTAGTPGSPLFSPSAGILSGQTLTSTTAGTATFTLPATAQNVIVTDPTTGLTATIYCVAGTGTGTGGVIPGTLSSAAAAWLEAQAAHGGLVLADNDTTVGDVEGVYLKSAFGEALFGKRVQVGTTTSPGFVTPGHDFSSDLLMWLTGGFLPTMATPAPPGQTTIKEDLDGLLANWLSVRGEGDLTFQAMLNQLQGTGAYSHADIVDAISSGGGTGILDELAAMRGDTTTSLATLLSSLAGIRTTHAYSLGDVKEWVDALPHGVDGPTALAVVAFVAALALAIPTGGASIAAEAVAVGAGPLLDVATLVEVVSVLGELAGIASSVASIRDSLSTPVSSGHPVWPGSSLVTLGTVHDLADDLVIDGPMHGLLFTITGQPVQPHKYMFDTVASWSRVGAVLFCTDRGDYERSQTFSLDAQIMTPQTMTEAASAVLRVNAGWTGTVRSWRTA